MNDSFVIMVKPVGSLCNMRCKYCYYLEKGKYSEHAKQTVMSKGLLEMIIKQTLEATDNTAASFVWHGGEPTLAGIDFYKRAVEFELKYAVKGARIYNNLQTNGLLIDKKWCEFLKKYGFDVGLSFDGSEAVHNSNRLANDGSGTFAKVMKSAGLLREYGIPFDILCTVNSETVKNAEAVYNAIKATGTTWAEFIPIVNRDENGKLLPESVTPKAYGELLKEIFDLWTHNDLGKMDIQLFAEMAKILNGGEASLCYMAPTCGRAIIAEEDGSIYSCDHFVDDTHRLGLLRNGSIKEMLESDEQKAFGESKQNSLSAECKVCPHLKLCNGGCLKDRVNGKYFLCEGLKVFFDYAVPILLDIMRQSSEGRTPQQIMNGGTGK